MTVSNAKPAGIYPLAGFESVQAAVNYVAGLGGGAVAIPPGGTLVPEGVQMKSGVILAGPPQEWDVEGFGHQVAWLEGTAATEAAILEWASGVFNSGLRDLAIQGALHNRQGIVFATASNRSGNRLRNVHVRKCGSAEKAAFLLNTAEVRCEDLMVFESVGTGIEVNGEDCQIDTLISGNNGGHGVVLGAEGKPMRGHTWDVFNNALKGLLMDGVGHKLFLITSEGNNQEGVYFRSVINTQIHGLVCKGNSRTTPGERYADVLFAHPTASNTGCAIIGGIVETSDGQQSFGVRNEEKTVSFPLVLGVAFHGAYNTATISPARNFEVIACPEASDITVPRNLALASRTYRHPGSSSFNGKDHWQALNKNETVVSGVRANGAIYRGVVESTLEANGAVALEAEYGNVFQITLKANATSSSITTGVKGQEITIEWVQDATGSRTYVWPENCKFMGGEAPQASTGKEYRDSVTFRYDGTNWYEVSRAVSIGGTLTTPFDATRGQNGMWACPNAGYAFGGAVAGGSLYRLARFVPTRKLVVVKIGFVTTVAATNNDAVDVGICNAKGEKLVSSGATTGVANAAAGVQKIVVGATTLLPGLVYYAGLAYGVVGGTAATIATLNGTNSGMFGASAGTVEATNQAGATLPATATFSANTGSPYALALLES